MWEWKIKISWASSANDIQDTNCEHDKIQIFYEWNSMISFSQGNNEYLQCCETETQVQETSERQL